MKYFLSGIFSLVAGVSSHARESRFFYENAVIVGKEYLVFGNAVAGNASENKDILQEQNLQPEIFLGDSSSIFIVENGKIYGKDHLFVKQNTHRHVGRNGNISHTAEKEVADNSTTVKTEDKTITVVSVFPFLPSPYLYIDRESAVTVSQQELGGHQPVSKTYRANIYPGIEKSNLSFLLEQRQKFSTAATQCGILTSVSPNSPPL